LRRWVPRAPPPRTDRGVPGLDAPEATKTGFAASAQHLVSDACLVRSQLATPSSSLSSESRFLVQLEATPHARRPAPTKYVPHDTWQVQGHHEATERPGVVPRNRPILATVRSSSRKGEGVGEIVEEREADVPPVQAGFDSTSHQHRQHQRLRVRAAISTWNHR
jgi:hypothetical protein